MNNLDSLDINNRGLCPECLLQVSCYKGLFLCTLCWQTFAETEILPLRSPGGYHSFVDAGKCKLGQYVVCMKCGSTALLYFSDKERLFDPNRILRKRLEYLAYENVMKGDLKEKIF